MNPHPFDIDDVVEFGCERGRVVGLCRNVKHNTIETITVLFEDGTKEWFDSAAFDDIDIVEEA